MSAEKEKRQETILNLIMKGKIGTQEELTAALEKAGFKVTQATVSRDIREMSLTKVAMSDGTLRYVALKETDENLSEKYRHVFCEGFLSMDNALNILVIKTVSGMAMAVAAALDKMNFKEIVGTIAGDDTIMCAVRPVEDTANVMSRLRKIVSER